MFGQADAQLMYNSFARLNEFTELMSSLGLVYFVVCVE